MGELFGQVWALQVGDQVFEGLDLRAMARWPKDSGPEVDVTVNHPGPTLRGLIEAREARVSVLAGYERDQGTVEIGGGKVVRDSIELDRSSPDRPFEFQLAGRSSTSEVVLALAFASITASEVIEQVRAVANLAGDIRLGQDIEYSRYDLSGGFSRIVEDVAGDTRSAWEVDGATLRMWPASEPRRQTADVWSSSTGLMRVSGSGNEIRARAMLRPALRPGDVIRIDDEGYDGDLVVVDASHEIDTYGGTWATQITGRPR